jgi:hypothetical protein
LHDKDGKISVKNLNRVIKDLIFNKLIVLIFFDIFGEYFGFPLYKKFFIALFDDGFALVIDLLFIHVIRFEIC